MLSEDVKLVTAQKKQMSADSRNQGARIPTLENRGRPDRLVRQGEHWSGAKARLKERKELLSSIYMGLETRLSATSQRERVKAKTSQHIRWSIPRGFLESYEVITQRWNTVMEGGPNEIKLLSNNLIPEKGLPGTQTCPTVTKLTPASIDQRLSRNAKARDKPQWRE